MPDILPDGLYRISLIIVIVTQELANITSISENQRTSKKKLICPQPYRKCQGQKWNLDLSPKPFLFSVFSIYVGG